MADVSTCEADASERQFSTEELLNPPQELLESCHLRFIRASRCASIDHFLNYGHYNQAANVFERLMTAVENAYGKDDVEYLRNVFMLARVRLKQQRFEDADQLLQTLWTKRQEVLGKDHRHTLNAMTTLADCYRCRGKLIEAKELFKSALPSVEQQWGPDHPNTCTVQNNLGLVFAAEKDYKAAKEIFQSSLARLEQHAEYDDLNLLAVLENLADAHRDLHEHKEAESLFKRILTIRVQSWGSEHPETIESMNSFARFYTHTDRADKALILYERVLAGQKLQLGEKHPETCATYFEIASLRFDQGLYDKAAAITGLLVADAEHDPHSKADFESTAQLEEHLYLLQFHAICLHKLQRFADSEGYHRKVLLALKDRADNDRLVVHSLYHLGALLYRECTKDRWPEAETYLNRALAVYKLDPKNNRRAFIVCVEAASEMFQDQSRDSEAEQLLRDYSATIEVAYGEHALETASALVTLALFYQDLGRWPEVDTLMARSLKIREAKLSPNDKECLVPLQGMALSAELQGSFEEAAKLYARAIPGMEEEFGSTYRDTKEVLRRQLNVLYTLGREEEELALLGHCEEVGVFFKRIDDSDDSETETDSCDSDAEELDAETDDVRCDIHSTFKALRSRQTKL